MPGGPRVSKGDIVTFRGTCVIDQDVGSGYQYRALSEQASIVAE